MTDSSDDKKRIPAIPHITEKHCLTCEYNARYNAILQMKELTMHATEEGSEQRWAAENAMSSEIWAVLALGSKIAEQRCEGNYMAAMSLLN